MDKMGLKPGPELGKAIQNIETDNFKKLLSWLYLFFKK
jgi:hypothetical protein